MNYNDIQAEIDDKRFADHEGEPDDIELSEAEQTIEEHEAVLRDIIFSCNEVLIDSPMTYSEFVLQIKRKAQAALR